MLIYSLGLFVSETAVWSKSAVMSVSSSPAFLHFLLPILLSFLGGCLGALLGMFLCRHKTKHAKFLILVPLSVILWAAGIGALIAHLLGAF